MKTMLSIAMAGLFLAACATTEATETVPAPEVAEAPAPEVVEAPAPEAVEAPAEAMTDAVDEADEAADAAETPPVVDCDPADPSCDHTGTVFRPPTRER